MPLFRASGEHGAKARPERRRRRRKMEWMGSRGKTDEEGSVLSLTQLCLLSLADNMKEVWVKDYADNYLNQYSFRHIMGPFNCLTGELAEELTWLLCTRKQLSRAALHLLLVPQLRGLSLERCPSLATSDLCAHISARCQALCSLDLSGAQQLPSKPLSDTLRRLPALRSLSLAGTPCDRCVIRTIAHHCPLLRHLDVSSCHSLSLAALLPLGGGASCSLSGGSSSFRCTSPSKSSTSPSCSDPFSSFSTSMSPLPLCSLLALDIGIAEEEGDPATAAAYLLLSLPCLERVAMEDLSQACSLIQNREFGRMDEFTDREGIPRLEQVWRERRHGQGQDSWRTKREERGDEGVEESILCEGYGSESDEDARREESCSESQAREKSRERVLLGSGNEPLTLRLRDVKGLTCESLDSLVNLCPDISSISMNLDDLADTRERSTGSRLAAGLKTWSGQLRSLSVHYPAHLVDLLPALQAAGSSLVSLTLEGVKTSHHTPLLEIIRACPNLKELLISAEPPTTPEEEENDIEQDEQDLPSLPNLCSLSLNFSYEHNQMRPAMSWRSLIRVIRCLLTGSPLLEKLSLVSLPCPLNDVLQDILHIGDLDLDVFAASKNSFHMPLGRVQRLHLPRTDVKMMTIKRIMQRSRRLGFVDVSYCWQISHLEWSDCKRLSGVQVVWV